MWGGFGLSTPLNSIGSREHALRVLQSLRQGSNCLEGVSSFSAGREILFKAAQDNLEELELSGGACVRWLKGRYGQGKTHVFARLIETAFNRNWVTSYVQVSGRGEGTELHRFEEIYASIIKNCLTSELVAEQRGSVDPGRVPGWEWILDKWFADLKRLAVGRETGDIPSFIVRDVAEQTMTAIRRRWSIQGSFADALRQYVIARIDGDEDWVQLILAWFRGENVHAQGGNVRNRLKQSGIREPIKRQNAKEMLRSLSTFIRYRGYGGILILLDEVENVLQQTPSARRTAYTVLRELIDNVDDRHGMTRAAFYISGTPDIFEGEKGLTEYEALAARVLLPSDFAHPNPAAAVVDLSHYPLTREALAEIGNKILKVHAAAKSWAPNGEVHQRLQERLDGLLSQNPDLNPRTWVRNVVEVLDQASMNS
jgi:hypothetical protein